MQKRCNASSANCHMEKTVWWWRAKSNKGAAIHGGQTGLPGDVIFKSEEKE